MRGPLDLFVELGGGGGGRDADRTDPAVVQSRQRLYLHKSAFCCLDSLGDYLGSASTRVATGEVLFFLIHGTMYWDVNGPVGPFCESDLGLYLGSINKCVQMCIFFKDSSLKHIWNRFHIGAEP